MSKKSVLIVSNHSFMLYRFRKRLLEELVKHFEVVVVVPFGECIEEIKKIGCKCIDVPVDRRGINPLKDLALLKEYFRIVDYIKPEKVITYSIKPNIYCGFAAKKRGIQYYVNVQGLGTAFEKKVISKVVSMMYKIALKKAKFVFFENTEDAGTFTRNRITTMNQTVVLRGAGVDLCEYPYEGYVNKDLFHFLYIGRIMKEKGMDEILEAGERLFKERKFKIDLVGFCEDEYEKRIKEMESLGIVEYHGFQVDPRPFYKNTDCVLMPSYHEGMSNVNLEASSTGRVVITSNIPGCREAITDGVSGFLVKPQDYFDLYTKMKEVLDMPKDRIVEMGYNARTKMENEFDKEDVVRKTFYYITI